MLTFISVIDILSAAFCLLAKPFLQKVALFCFISLALSEVAWNKKESLEAVNDSSTFLHQLSFH
jgi:hypothetical protein